VLFTTEDSINQLKQSILQLAVMGKLVPQNPNDEPASELLKKIAAEKAQLVKEGKIKAQKPLPPIGDDEKPFELPKGWEWVRLGEITEIKGGKRVSNGYQLLTYPTPYIYIRVTDMKDGSIDDTDLRYIDKDMYEKISRYIITKNDIYMTIVGATIGKCGLIPEKFDQMNLTENAARITPSSCIEKVFLYKCLDGAICQNQFLDKTKQVGVQKMALNRLADTTIPLPPLAEQQRIVTKVDQLMALCDQLKNQLNQAKHLQGKIADVLVEQALSNNV
jgi:type I restriction enzyme S subunit